MFNRLGKMRSRAYASHLSGYEKGTREPRCCSMLALRACLLKC